MNKLIAVTVLALSLNSISAHADQNYKVKGYNNVEKVDGVESKTTDKSTWVKEEAKSKEEGLEQELGVVKEGDENILPTLSVNQLKEFGAEIISFATIVGDATKSIFSYIFE